jgi:hypothetical protein
MEILQNKLIASAYGKRSLFILITLLVIISGTNIGCRKNKIEPEDEKSEREVYPEKYYVKTYEIISLVVKGFIEERYNGTFGGAHVDLIKTSDSTLTFIVPELNSGEHLLTFDLKKITFNVSATELLDPELTVSALIQKFDEQIASSDSTLTNYDLQLLTEYKQSVLKLFSSLTDEQKKQTMLFYNANKEVFDSFISDAQKNLDGPVTLSEQSKCPRTDYKTFYDCTSANLSHSLTQLKSSSKNFLEMAGFATIMAGTALSVSALGPVAWGITAVGMALPTGAAVYLALFEILPSTYKTLKNTGQFIKTPWIFREEIFDNIKREYANDNYTSLNLNSGFRSIKSDDYVTKNTGKFNNALSSLSSIWEKLSNLFGSLPSYVSNEKSVSITTGDISISNISNSNVVLVEQSGEQVKFKSLLGQDETFSYTVKVTKEGFVKEKTVSGKITAGLSNLLGLYFNNPRPHQNCLIHDIQIYYDLNFEFDKVSPVGGTIVFRTCWGNDDCNYYYDQFPVPSEWITFNDGKYVLKISGKAFCWGNENTILIEKFYYISPTGVESPVLSVVVPK